MKTKMKKGFALPLSLCACAFAALWTSCVSSPASPPKTDSKLSAVAKELKDLKLAPGETWVRELAESEEKWSSNAFSAANNMLSLDNWFDFRKSLADDKIAELAKLLFADLPKAEGRQDLRVVAIGGVFPGDAPLIVIVSQVELKEGVVAGRNVAIQYLTNSAKYRAQDKETGETRLMSMGNYIDSSLCLSRLVVPYDNGDFVLSSNLDLGKTKIEALKDDAERANAMDTFIKDEDPENDSRAAGLREAVEKSETAPAEVKILAKMNWGLLLLKEGKPDEAEALWASLLPEVPSDADPSLGEALTKDTAFLLDIWRAWR